MTMDRGWKYYRMIVDIVGSERSLTTITKNEESRSCTIIKYSEDLHVQWSETITWESLDRDPELVLECLRFKLIFS
jgi:hypothetical protein